MRGSLLSMSTGQDIVSSAYLRLMKGFLGIPQIRSFEDSIVSLFIGVLLGYIGVLLGFYWGSIGVWDLGFVFRFLGFTI